jgi:paired small multidrug resistance pump
MDSLFTILGLLGVAINLVAYGLLTAGKLHADTLAYQVINVCGTAGILLSLVAQWNLPVFLGNIAWLVIALVGVARILLKQKRSA